MANFCENCGSPLAPGTKFCMSCGKPVAQPAANKPVEQPLQQPIEQPQQPIQQPMQPPVSRPTHQQQVIETVGQYPQSRQQQPPVYGQPQQPKKKGKAKVLVPLVSVLLVAAILVTGFWQLGFFRKRGGSSTTLSPETTSAVVNGVTVDVGDFVLDGEAKLSVSQGKSEDHADEGYKIDVYDIKLGDLHELGDYITIRIPYDTTYCKKGQDPAKCVGAKYKNDATGKWEDILFEVDAEKQELVIYTDHLSYYGVLYVEDEGKRKALVTDVMSSSLSMDSATAIKFAERIAANDASVKKDLIAYGAELSNDFVDYADRLDNAINIATLGDIPKWLDTSIPDTNQTLFSAIGYTATASNLLKIALKDSIGGGADKGDVLNLIRDVGSKVTTYWADALTSTGGAALSVGMGGVLIIDKMLTAFAQEAQSTKMEDIAYVYHHYNEGFSGPTWAHKLMKPKDWREQVIQVLEKHPNDPEIAIAALEAGFRKYASEFFDLSDDQMAEVASDVPNVTVKRIPNFTEAEKEKLIEEYIAHLKEKTMPAVLKSVQNYMIKKAEEAELQSIGAVKDYYNSKITITMQENLPEGGKSQYAGYQFRFAPLNDTAAKSNWSGKWPASGSATDTSTLIGFMTAGYPHTVEFFKPDANMDTDKPEFTVPFVISVPSIRIDLAPSGLSAEAVAGTYHITGYDAWDDFEDDWYNWKESDSLDITVTAQGENRLYLSGSEFSQPTSSYDPSTGSCSYTDEDGLTVHIQFSESGGVYSVSLSYDQTFEDGRAYGSYSGTKR